MNKLERTTSFLVQLKSDAEHKTIANKTNYLTSRGMHPMTLNWLLELNKLKNPSKGKYEAMYSTKEVKVLKLAEQLIVKEREYSRYLAKRKKERKQSQNKLNQRLAVKPDPCLVERFMYNNLNIYKIITWQITTS